MNSGKQRCSKRIESLDLAKGFGIVLVVVFHVMGAVADDYFFRPLLTSCFLAIFFMVSGMLYHAEENTRVAFRKYAHRLLLPFALCYIATSVLLPLLLNAFHVKVVAHGLKSLYAFIISAPFTNFTLWFLLALFLIYVIHVLALRIIRSQLLLLLLAILLGTIGFLRIEHGSFNLCFSNEALFYYGSVAIVRG